jgi:hypothetical protein
MPRYLIMLIVMHTLNYINLSILQQRINKHHGKYKEAFTHMATGLPQQSKMLAKFLFKTSFNIFPVQIDKWTHRNPTARD